MNKASRVAPSAQSLKALIEEMKKQVDAIEHGLARTELEMITEDMTFLSFKNYKIQILEGPPNACIVFLYEFAFAL